MSGFTDCSRVFLACARLKKDTATDENDTMYTILHCDSDLDLFITIRVFADPTIETDFEISGTTSHGDTILARAHVMALWI